MNNKLLELVKKPEIWQRSNEPFWDDFHISKSMLEMHLNPDLELASRKHVTIEKSVKWLNSIIKENSKILDLGCGPGLYTSKLSKLNYDVTGIDYSKRSIDFAKMHDKLTKYIYKNYLEIDYENEFDVIILIYCDYAALTKEERKILLSKIHSALKPNGMFIFDVFTIHSFKNNETLNTWEFFENGGYWSPYKHICLESTHKYENDTITLNQYTIITEEETKNYLIWNTMYDIETLTLEMKENNFEVVEKYDDVCGKSYTGKEDTLCLITRAKL